MNRLRTSVALAAVVMVLAACGPAASSDSGEPSAAESTAASVAPSEAQASQGGPEPSISAGLVPALEALIPDTVGSMTISKESMAGSEFLVSPESDPASVKFVEDLGVAASDISIAVGFGFSSDGSSSLIMFVIRAEGAQTDALVSGFKEATNAQRDEPLTWTSDQVGGKTVEVAVDGETTIYLYAKDDVLFFISADPATAEETISGLP